MATNNISINKNILFYLTEYLVMLGTAVGIVSLMVVAHSIGIPLYKINPMHWVLYYVILLKKPSLSSIAILAIALPITSSIATGHPLIIKSMIMCVELLLYGLVFNFALHHHSKTIFQSYLLSQFIGHLIYYGIKYTLIRIGALNSVLFASSVILQIIVVILLGISLQLLSKYKLENQ
jgi:hypothetical protein